MHKKSTKKDPVVNLGQNASWACPNERLPRVMGALLQKSEPWSLNDQRGFVAGERMEVMGIPIYLDPKDPLRCPFADEVVSINPETFKFAEISMMTGNGMHMISIGAPLLHPLIDTMIFYWAYLFKGSTITVLSN